MQAGQELEARVSGGDNGHLSLPCIVWHCTQISSVASSLISALIKCDRMGVGAGTGREPSGLWPAEAESTEIHRNSPAGVEQPVS